MLQMRNWGTDKSSTLLSHTDPMGRGQHLHLEGAQALPSCEVRLQRPLQLQLLMLSTLHPTHNFCTSLPFCLDYFSTATHSPQFLLAITFLFPDSFYLPPPLAKLPYLSAHSPQG